MVSLDHGPFSSPELRLKAAPNQLLLPFLIFVEVKIKLYSSGRVQDTELNRWDVSLFTPDGAAHFSGGQQTHHREQRQI